MKRPKLSGSTSTSPTEEEEEEGTSAKKKAILKKAEQALEDLHARALPFVMRRLKGDVLKELPPKVIQVIQVEMSPLQVSNTRLLLLLICIYSNY